MLIPYISNEDFFILYQFSEAALTRHRTNFWTADKFDWTLRSHGTVQYFALFTLACVAGRFWCVFFFVVRKVRVTASRKVYRGRNRKRKNKKKTPATQTIFTEKFEHFSVLNISSQCFFLQLTDSVYLKLNQKRDSCLNKRISLSVHYINFPSTFSLWLTKAFVHMSHHLKPWQR